MCVIEKLNFFQDANMYTYKIRVITNYEVNTQNSKGIKLNTMQMFKDVMNLESIAKYSVDSI